MKSIFGKEIRVYTRAEALEDGVLVDVSSLAREAGFKFPVAITAEVNNIIKSIPKECSYQSRNGRLWDVLFVAAFNCRKSRGTTVYYDLIMHREVETAKGIEIKEELTLKAVIGPGDNFEPVITIMLPSES